MIGALAAVTPEAAIGLALVKDLRDACDRHGNLPRNRRPELGSLIGMLEARLA